MDIPQKPVIPRPSQPASSPAQSGTTNPVVASSIPVARPSTPVMVKNTPPMANNGQSNGKIVHKGNPINTIAKYLSISLFTLCVCAYSLLHMDLDPSNSFLSLVGIEANTKVKNVQLNREKKYVQTELTILTNRNKKLSHFIRLYQENQLANKANKNDIALYDNANVISRIIENQKQWSDEVIILDSDFGDKEILKMGMLDLPKHLENYFKSNAYEHDILSNNFNDIKVQNFSVHQNQVNFTVEAGNFLGNVFMLGAEFSRLVNQFPEYENGKIRTFSRSKNRGGDDIMVFNLAYNFVKPDPNAKIEYSTEYEKYQKWALNNSLIGTSSNSAAKAAAPKRPTPRKR